MIVICINFFELSIIILYGIFEFVRYDIFIKIDFKNINEIIISIMYSIVIKR